MDRPTHEEHTYHDGSVERVTLEYAVVRNDKLNQLLWKIQDDWNRQTREFGPKWADPGKPTVMELADAIDDLSMFINELSDDVHELCIQHTYEVAESDAIEVKT
tara:strand:+ start:1296 stop:1607 length:312 start_codon:yes stop_codon:yes gene_type:complete